MCKIKSVCCFQTTDRHKSLTIAAKLRKTSTFFKLKRLYQIGFVKSNIYLQNGVVFFILTLRVYGARSELESIIFDMSQLEN